MSEYDLRQTLEARDETILDQRDSPTKKPSLKWVYFLFRVVNELWIYQDDVIRKLIVNVDSVLRRIIRYFGVHAEMIYLNST